MNNAIDERVSIEEVGKMWNTEERTYTDGELRRIRDWMYKVKGLIMESWQQEQSKMSEVAKE